MNHSVKNKGKLEKSTASDETPNWRNRACNVSHGFFHLFISEQLNLEPFTVVLATNLLAVGEVFDENEYGFISTTYYIEVKKPI